MQKQALAFLTMFSLVLMLSVYYVTLPNEQVEVMKVEEQSPKKDETKVSESNDEQDLQKKINEKIEKELHTHSKELTKDTNKNGSKEEAIKQMDQAKNKQKTQDMIRTRLHDLGIDSSVEIVEEVCSVTVFKQKETKQLAYKVIKEVYAMIHNQYRIELIFK